MTLDLVCLPHENKINNPLNTNFKSNLSRLRTSEESRSDRQGQHASKAFVVKKNPEVKKTNDFVTDNVYYGETDDDGDQSTYIYDCTVDIGLSGQRRNF